MESFMETAAKEITSITIENELKQSYLDYAMSVIVGRALPDVRDGLKPVHRRVLFAMNVLKNDFNKPYKKSARVVGDVIGKYHPHGDTAVYDTIVRMAQPFSLRYMLVDGQGNFGSVDGDAPAAMRYTEIRMSKLAHSLLADLEKETVDFAPNYDGTEFAPTVLPTRVPNLLVNGSSGIAVGMATNIPPHNLNEVVDATIALLQNPDLTIQDLMQHLPAPDFPTAGIINGRAGIAQAYATGRGKLLIRAKADIETQDNGRASIIVSELPYQVNKARLLEKIGELVRDKKLEGISGLRDESDKDGMRMVVEVKRAEQPDVVLNNLFRHTQMQVTFGINMVALDKGQPRTMNIKDILEAFLQHRREVVVRRSQFELRKARQRAHTLEGLAIALANIDPVIALIKAAKTPAEAKMGLLARTWAGDDIAALLSSMGADETRPHDLLPVFGLHNDGYHLSDAQAQAILELRLHRLTGLEKDKIHQEYAGLIEQIQKLLKILSDVEELHRIIHEELIEVKEQFGDERRTVVLDSQEDLCHEDFINEEDVVVTLSKEGYIKTQSLDSYQSQHRGGRGKKATQMKEEDVVDTLLIANTHDTILCFSTLGKVYWLRVFQVPQGSRTSRGRPIINILPLQKEEEISAILPIGKGCEKKFVFMTTSTGKVKRVSLTEFARQRSSGKIAIALNEGDKLIGAKITDGDHDVMLFASSGKAIRFNEQAIRVMGRGAQGVRGISLKDNQQVVSLIILKPNGCILTATENGYGQRTRPDDYRVIGRGGQGVIAIQITGRNGLVIGAKQVEDHDDILLISDQGTMVRTPVAEISVVGRNTQGVRLIQLGDNEKLVSIAAIENSPEEEVAEQEVAEQEGDQEAAE